MKRLGNVLTDLISYENCLTSFINGTERKRNKAEIRKYLFTDQEAKDYLPCFHQINPKLVEPFHRKISKEIKDMTYRVSEPKHRHVYLKSKSKEKGKWRDLYMPSFKDHIVNHMLMQSCMSAFTKGMHPYCCGSVPGRGPRFVVKTVSGWMKKDKQCRYFVVVDIKQFFMSIRSDIMMDILKRKIKDIYALWLFQMFLESCTVPCPMGYFSSPWLANLYLEELDWYIERQLYKERRGKRIKYVRHFIRYIDDYLLIGTSKCDLRKAVKAIENFLINQRDLKIKQTWEIKKIGHHEIIEGKRKLTDGYYCDYVGYKFCKDTTIMRGGIYLATKRLVKRMYKSKHYEVSQCASLTARLGWAKHCDSFDFMNQTVKRYINISDMRRVLSHVYSK